MNILKENNLIGYTFAFFISTFLVVYVFNIPTLITNEIELVHEYYYTNILESTILDYFLIFIYIYIAIYFMNKYNIQKIEYKIIILLLTTFIISNLFYIIFINLPKSKNFFSRWFYKVGIKASIYDCFIILSTYLIYLFVIKKLK